MNDHDEAHLFDEGDMTEDDVRQYLLDTACDGAQEALHHVGYGDIDPRILAEVLTADPSITADGNQWGWTDTEVRDRVTKAVSCRILGISEKDYLTRLRQGERELNAEVMAAHGRWVADNPPAGL